MGKGKATTVGYRYYMSLHMGISRGPIDEIVQLDVGNVRAWPLPDGDPEAVGGLMTIATGPNGSGVAQYEDGTHAIVDAAQINTIQGSGDYTIAAESIFGGDKKEGGIAGTLRVMMGHASQVVPAYIKTMMGGRVPDFRGVVTLFFDGLLTSINPYPKTWEWRVRRTESGWDGSVWQPSLVTIWLRGGTIKAMNPAHILYEAFTNRDWGRGLSRDDIEDAVWLKSAETLYNERLGLCLRYNRQSELSEFIQNVLDHVGGSIYPDRSTGRLSFDLLRDNYNLDELPLYTYDSGLISLDDVETSGQDDLVNEVIVKWTDPISKSERAARVQNIALNQSMGASNSTSKTYAGISDVDLALRMCQRDLKANSNSVKRFTLALDRRAWQLAPGKAFRISVPDRGIFNAVLRAGKVSEAGGTDGRIRVDAVLDVFGLPAASFIAPQSNEWVNPSREALVADKRIVREVTYGELVTILDPANLDMLDSTAGGVVSIVGKPSSLSQGYDMEITPEGSSEPNSGAGSFAPYVISANPIPLQGTDTTISFTLSSDIGLITVGTAVQIGDEIGRLVNIVVTDLAQTVTVARGCYDTVPLAHPAGTPIYFIRDAIGSDEREYASGEDVEVKILPFTSTSKLSSSLAPTDVVTIRGRQARPYPPADLKVNGTRYTSLPPQAVDLTITWVHRNRVVQQDQLVSHSEAGVSPEAGTTYTVRVYAGNTSTPVRTFAGITGTSVVYTTEMISADGVIPEAWFEIESQRSGLLSLNKYRFKVDLALTGYGFSGYGEAYGN